MKFTRRGFFKFGAAAATSGKQIATEVAGGVLAAGGMAVAHTSRVSSQPQTAQDFDYIKHEQEQKLLQEAWDKKRLAYLHKVASGNLSERDKQRLKSRIITGRANIAALKSISHVAKDFIWARKCEESNKQEYVKNAISEIKSMLNPFKPKPGQPNMKTATVPPRGRSDFDEDDGYFDTNAPDPPYGDNKWR